MFTLEQLKLLRELLDTKGLAFPLEKVRVTHETNEALNAAIAAKENEPKPV